MAEFNFNPQLGQIEEFNRALDEIKHERGAAMMALQKAQEIFKYIPREIMEKIAAALDLSLSELYGVATFYAQFNLKPVGKHKISVCLGTACYVKGSGEILEKLKTLLKIEQGETTADGNFTLEASRCVGCCGLAPVLTVGDDVYGRLQLKDVEQILSKYGKGEK